MVCPPVREDPRALASGLFPVQADKPWYNYYIPPALVLTFFIMKYFTLKFAISGKDRVTFRCLARLNVNKDCFLEKNLYTL